MGLLKSQLTTLSGGSTNSPVDPNLTLDLEFSSMTVLPASVTFTRASIGTYFDSNGVLQTALAGAARFDHDPVTLEPLGLLIEEARTNALPYSLDCFTGWTGSLVPTINSTVSPDGTASATLFTATGANQNWFRATSIAAGDTYTFSAFVKRKTGVGVVQMQCAGAGYTAVPVTDIWTRVSVTAAVTAGSKNSVFQINTAGDEVWIWGAQLEAGAFPTSYIPTTSAAVPRSADNARMTGVDFSSWYDPLKGTVLIKAQALINPAYPAVWAIGKGAGLGNMLLSQGSPNGRLLGELRDDSGTSQVNFFSGLTLSDRQPFLAALAYATDDAGFAVNGVSMPRDNSVIVPTGMLSMSLGNKLAAQASAGAFDTTRIAFLKYWNVAKTDAELQEITNPAKY